MSKILFAFVITSAQVIEMLQSISSNGHFFKPSVNSHTEAKILNIASTETMPIFYLLYQKSDRSDKVTIIGFGAPIVRGGGGEGAGRGAG